MANNKTSWDQSLNTTHISDYSTYYEAARNSFFVFYVDPSELTNLYSPDVDPDGTNPGNSKNDIEAGKLLVKEICNQFEIDINVSCYFEKMINGVKCGSFKVRLIFWYFYSRK